MILLMFFFVPKYLRGIIFMKKTNVSLDGKKSTIKLVVLVMVLLIAAVVLTGCGNNEEEFFTTVDELRERHVAGVNAPIVITVMDREFPDAEVTLFNQNMDMVAALLAGQIDGFMVSRPTSFFIERSNPELMVIQDPLTDSQAGVGVRRGNTELLAAINEAIDEIRADGYLEEMVDRWYDMDNRNTEMPNIPRVTEGEVLRVGVAEALEPASFLNAQRELVGFDIELIFRIAYILDRPVEFVPLEMAAYAGSIESGIVDMIIANWIINPALTGVEFSQAYFDTPFLMVVRRGN